MSETNRWKHGVHAGRARLRLKDFIAQRADPGKGLESQRCLHERRRVEQNVDPLPVLEVRRDPGDEAFARGRAPVLGADLDPVRNDVHEPPRKPEREQEVHHGLQGGRSRARGASGRPPPAGSVASARRSAPARHQAGGGLVPADPCRDLLWHPVEHAGGRARRAGVPASTPEQAGTAGRGCGRRRHWRRRAASPMAPRTSSLCPTGATSTGRLESARKVSATGWFPVNTSTSTPSAATRGTSCLRVSRTASLDRPSVDNPP